MACVNTSVASRVCHHNRESKPFERNAREVLNKSVFFLSKAEQSVGMSRANPLRFPRFIRVLPHPIVCGATETNSARNDCQTTRPGKPDVIVSCVFGRPVVPLYDSGEIVYTMYATADDVGTVSYQKAGCRSAMAAVCAASRRPANGRFRPVWLLACRVDRRYECLYARGLVMRPHLRGAARGRYGTVPTPISMIGTVSVLP